MRLTPDDIHPLAIPAPQPPAIAATLAQLHELKQAIEATLEQGEIAMQQLRVIAGDEPTGIAAELHRRFNFGCGFWRECDAILGTLWREKNVREKAAQNL